jgi:hypothetical protein
VSAARFAPALLVAGCLGGSPTTPINAACQPPVCKPQTGVRYVAEVVPSSATSHDTVPPPAEEFVDVQIDAQTGQFALRLSEPVTISGTLKVGDQPLTGSPATLVATRPSRIAGRPDVYYQAKVDAMTGQFTITVSPTFEAETYTLRVLFDDAEAHPPQQYQVQAQKNGTYDPLFDPEGALTLLDGRVTSALKAGIPDVTVVALDGQSRATLSTTTITDADGHFTLKLPPSVVMPPPPAAPRPIVLVATPPKDARLPTLERKMSLPILAASIELPMPALPATTRLAYRVVGVSPSGAQVSIVGAHCQFTANVSDGSSDALTATSQVETETEADGTAVVDLLPADGGNRTYHVSVSPPAGSDFELTSTSVSVGHSDGYGAPIVLALRPQLSGRVLDPHGTPLRNLVIQPGLATVDGSVALVALAAAPKIATTITDSDGRFALRLDAGTYEIGLIPPPLASLPWRWLDATPVTADTDVGDVVLSPGVMVHGLVKDAGGKPLEGADVKLYTTSTANDSCMGDPACLKPARLRAEGTATAEGLVPMLLPQATAMQP